jgi:hypothetical protein
MAGTLEGNVEGSSEEALQPDAIPDRGAKAHEKRRRFLRHACSASVCISWTIGFDKYATGECLDISRIGLCTLVSEPIPVRTTVCFKSDSLALSGSGTVRHHKRQNGKYIVGLEFGGGLKWHGDAGT